MSDEYMKQREQQVEASLQFAKAFGVEAWEPYDKNAFRAVPHLDKATSFLNDPRKLEKMKRLLRTPGSVIKLRCPLTLSFVGQQFVFCNRSSYIRLHQIKLQIEAAQKARGQAFRLHVTGLQECGSYAYMIAEMLHTMVEKHDVPDFKIICISDDCRPYGYTPSTGWYSFGRMALGLRLMRKYSSSTYCFVCYRDVGMVNCNTVLASGSQVPFFENFVKYRCERRVLPEWNPQEVADRRLRILLEKHGYMTIQRKSRKLATPVIDRCEPGSTVVKANPSSVGRKAAQRRGDPAEATMAYFRDNKSSATLLRERQHPSYDKCLGEDDNECYRYYRDDVFDFSINRFTLKRHSDPNFEIAAASSRFLVDISFGRPCIQDLRRLIAAKHPLSRMREVEFAKLCHITLCDRFCTRDENDGDDEQGKRSGDNKGSSFSCCWIRPDVGRPSPARAVQLERTSMPRFGNLVYLATVSYNHSLPTGVVE